MGRAECYGMLERTGVESGGMTCKVRGVFMGRLGRRRVEFICFGSAMEERRRLMTEPLSLPRSSLVGLVGMSVGRGMFSGRFMYGLGNVLSG